MDSPIAHQIEVEVPVALPDASHSHYPDEHCSNRCSAWSEETICEVCWEHHDEFDRLKWEEPGRHIDERGAIIYAWPPQGRFGELWKRFDSLFPDSEKHELLALVLAWRDENSTLVSTTDLETGENVELEPKWDEIANFLKEPEE